MITFPFGSVSRSRVWHGTGVSQYDVGIRKCPEHPESRMVDCAVDLYFGFGRGGRRWGFWDDKCFAVQPPRSHSCDTPMKGADVAGEESVMTVPGTGA